MLIGVWRRYTTPTPIRAPAYTYASSQLLAGTPVLEVSRALGHASVAFTLQVYTHLLPKIQDNASANAGRMLA